MEENRGYAGNDEDGEELVDLAPREEETSHNEGDDNLLLANEAQQLEEDTSKYRAVADLDKILCQDDPDRMKLTHEEHRWAVAIKRTIEMMPDVDNLSDFMYAQFAIACRGNTDEVVHRCIALQDFREEYKVLDQPNEGYKCLSNPFAVFPELYLSFSFSQSDGTYVYLQDLSKFEPNKNFTSPQQVNDWKKGMYYFYCTFSPDFESIRKGIIALLDCKDCTILRRDALKYGSELFSQLLSKYPLYGRARHYNTGAMVNVMCSILRQILPNRMKDRFEVGLPFEGNLRDIFLTPTVEAANKRMLTRMRETLRLRYHNIESFKL